MAFLKKASLLRLILDVLCFLIIGIPNYLLQHHGKPFNRGFYCDDESLRYPYKHDTVSPEFLHFIGIIIPTAVIFVNEIFCSKRSQNQWYSSTSFMNLYRTLGGFYFGLICSELVTNVGKLTIGRLRPHFHSVCVPDIDCKAPEYQDIYIRFFDCLEGSKQNLREMRMSFPSGHSSFSAYTMLYLAIYIQARVSVQPAYLLKNIMQLVCTLIVWWISLSRISDYKHHWSDVLVGIIIGGVIAFFTTFNISNLFEKNRSRIKGLPVTVECENINKTFLIDEKPSKLL